MARRVHPGAVGTRPGVEDGRPSAPSGVQIRTGVADTTLMDDDSRTRIHEACRALTIVGVVFIASGLALFGVGITHVSNNGSEPLRVLTLSTTSGILTVLTGFAIVTASTVAREIGRAIIQVTEEPRAASQVAPEGDA